MSSTINLLVFIMTDGQLERIALSINIDTYNIEQLQYYNENDNLKSELKLSEDDFIVRVEEIHDVIIIE